MVLELQPNLESVLISVNKHINIDNARQRYANHFEVLKHIIFKKLREFQPFGSLFNGYQMGGSYGDNLKVTLPDEFDLVFHIAFPEYKLINVVEDHHLPGNVHLDFTKVLKKIRNEKQHAVAYKRLIEWLNDQNFLIVEKMQAYFQSCFTRVMIEMQWSLDSVALSYRRCGPAHTIDVNEEGFYYSVDFVPGILLEQSQSIVPRHVGQWEAIPKPICGAIRSTSFRSSFYRQEQALINDKYNLKNALRMMKKFRDKNSNLSNMKSYFIKTLFLWKAKEEHQSYWRQPLSKIIVDMFRSLETSLKMKKLLFFWDQRLNMYDRYTHIQLSEMLGCVANSRKLLERAALSMDIFIQKKVYALFFTVTQTIVHNSWKVTLSYN
ncbi:cyclic GMP-AMP synthase-like receptor isoform X2 [Stomoxys calcitrans]|uniref:cyclic GMP-AMP synthase-like receptor isoform X2 n=1 Tax=Stomoxys calcitrans TaxID=35570 RepID=UPI0027E35680|nr:cyclic GMP-AMP synthase-like receptor isoform X2 [Stomoxys calcitrans]